MNLQQQLALIRRQQHLKYVYGSSVSLMDIGEDCVFVKIMSYIPGITAKQVDQDRREGIASSEVDGFIDIWSTGLTCRRLYKLMLTEPEIWEQRMIILDGSLWFGSRIPQSILYRMCFKVKLCFYLVFVCAVNMGVCIQKINLRGPDGKDAKVKEMIRMLNSLPQIPSIYHSDIEHQRYEKPENTPSLKLDQEAIIGNRSLFLELFPDFNQLLGFELLSTPSTTKTDGIENHFLFHPTTTFSRKSTRLDNQKRKLKAEIEMCRRMFHDYDFNSTAHSNWNLRLDIMARYYKSNQFYLGPFSAARLDHIISTLHSFTRNQFVLEDHLSKTKRQVVERAMDILDTHDAIFSDSRAKRLAKEYSIWKNSLFGTDANSIVEQLLDLRRDNDKFFLHLDVLRSNNSNITAEDETLELEYEDFVDERGNVYTCKDTE